MVVRGDFIARCHLVAGSASKHMQPRNSVTVVTVPLKLPSYLNSALDKSARSF